MITNELTVRMRDFQDGGRFPLAQAGQTVSKLKRTDKGVCYENREPFLNQCIFITVPSILMSCVANSGRS